MKKSIFIPLLLISLQGLGTVNIDSLLKVWNDPAQPDTIRLKAMHTVAWNGYLFTQPDSAFYYAGLQYDLAQKKGLKKYEAEALVIQGISFAIAGDYTRAIEYFTRCLRSYEETGDKKEEAKTLGNIGNIYKDMGNYAKAIDYYTRCLMVMEECSDKKGIAASLNNIGIIHYEQGDYTMAKNYYTRCLKIKEEIGDKNGVAAALNNIGNVYRSQVDYAKAIDYYTRCLKAMEESNDKIGIAASLKNIGIIYYEQGDTDKAIDHYLRSLQIEEERGDKPRIASSLNNIAVIYYEQGEVAKSIDYHTRSLRIREEAGDKQGVATSLNNIGKIYTEEGETTKANDYLMRSLKINEEIGHKQGMANVLSSIAESHRNQGDYSKAIIYSRKALAVAREVGVVNEIRDAANSLYKSYQITGQHQFALSNYELYIQMRDSIESEESQKEVIRQEYKYNYEKQAATDSIKAAEAQKVSDALILAQEEQIARERIQRFALYGGLGLLFVFGGFMFNRFRVTQRQKKIIEHQKTEVETQRDIATQNHQEAQKQKQLVEEKNKEITDSINYAKRLQNAILPSSQMLFDHLKNGFVLFKPKDIVSGDFYFMDVVEEGSKKLIYYVAADCTGHGVPGAMVSIVGANGLKRCIQEFGLRKPGEILDKLSELVAENFSQSEEKIRDGMDLALCCLEFKNEKAVKVHYAGANNPLWIIPVKPRENLQGFRNLEGLYEIRATKQAIGYTENRQPFESHTVELEKGDTLYTFSDGYVDQFGGEKGKKFKSANFKRLLLSIQDKTMDEQKQTTDKVFKEWKGELEQVDDICIIGVRI